jgi:hypothetical protein
MLNGPGKWDKLDEVMRQYAPKLRDDLRIDFPFSNGLASAIASDVGCMSAESLLGIANNDMVGLSRRIDELVAFEHFMDFSHSWQATRGAWGPLTRAQVVSQLYVVFVYLGDACFARLRSLAPDKSVLKKCCGYLNDFPVRGLRNAVAHANWCYTDDFTGIRFHYHKDEDRTVRADYTVSQLELDFWDKLARVTAYAAFQTIIERLRVDQTSA